LIQTHSLNGLASSRNSRTTKNKNFPNFPKAEGEEKHNQPRERYFYKESQLLGQTTTTTNALWTLLLLPIQNKDNKNSYE